MLRNMNYPSIQSYYSGLSFLYGDELVKMKRVSEVLHRHMGMKALTSLPCYCSKGMATQSLCGFPVLLWLFLFACPRNFFLVSPGLVLTEMNHALCTLHILRQNISWKCNHSLVTA